MSNPIGDTVGAIGSFLGLPELGISELLGGTQNYQQEAAADLVKSGVNTGDGTGYLPVTAPNEVLGTTQTTPTNLTGTSTGGGSSYSADDLKYINDQIANLTGQQGRYGTALRDGLTSLGDSYNKNVSDQNLNQQRNLERYGTQLQDTEAGRGNALGQVDTGARTLADSLRRMLGMASGSDSSAYQITAPGAVARDASGKRGDVLDTYGRNFRDINKAKDDSQTDFERLLADLSAQRKQGESSLRSGVLSGQNELSTQLADAEAEKQLLLGGGYDQVRQATSGYRGDISNREAKLDNLFTQFRTPYNIEPINAQIPDLAQYTTDRTAINANNSGQTSPYSPYAQLLKKRNEQLQ